MKRLLILTILIAGSVATKAQVKNTSITNRQDSLQKVEAGCGQCMFKMKGGDCDLAVKLNGMSYFVDGTKIDDHGDAHADNGFCNRVRKAEVSGKVVNDRFVATSFKLLPEEKTVEKN